MIAHAWSQSEDCRVEGKCKMLAWTKENCSPKQARPRTRFCAPSTWLTWKIKLKKSKNHSAWMLYFTKPTKFNSWKIPTKLNDEVYKYCSRQLVLWISDECKVLCKWFHDLIKRSMESSLPLKMVNQVQPWKKTPKINLSHETKVNLLPFDIVRDFYISSCHFILWRSWLHLFSLLPARYTTRRDEDPYQIKNQSPQNENTKSWI